jgi:hypothetical protein
VAPLDCAESLHRGRSHSSFHTAVGDACFGDSVIVPLRVVSAARIAN